MARTFGPAGPCHDRWLHGLVAVLAMGGIAGGCSSSGTDTVNEVGATTAVDAAPMEASSTTEPDIQAGEAIPSAVMPTSAANELLTELGCVTDRGLRPSHVTVIGDVEAVLCSDGQLIGYDHAVDEVVWSLDDTTDAAEFGDGDLLVSRSTTDQASGESRRTVFTLDGLTGEEGVTHVDETGDPGAAAGALVTIDGAVLLVDGTNDFRAEETIVTSWRDGELLASRTFPGAYSLQWLDSALLLHAHYDVLDPAERAGRRHMIDPTTLEDVDTVVPSSEWLLSVEGRRATQIDDTLIDVVTGEVLVRTSERVVLPESSGAAHPLDVAHQSLHDGIAILEVEDPTTGERSTVAVDAATGDERWRIAETSAGVMADGTAFASDRSGGAEYLLLDLHTGEQIGTADLFTTVVYERWHLRVDFEIEAPTFELVRR